MTEFLLADVFDHALDADFHGGSEGPVDAGLEDEEVADFYRSDEIEMVHGSSDDGGAGVTAGGHGSGEIDELHEAAAEEVAEGVGVAGEDDLGALGLGVGDGARGDFGHIFIVMAARVTKEQRLFWKICALHNICMVIRWCP